MTSVFKMMKLLYVHNMFSHCISEKKSFINIYCIALEVRIEKKHLDFNTS